MKYILSNKVRSLWVDAQEYWSFKDAGGFLRYFLAAHDPRFNEMDTTLKIFDIQDEDVPPAKPGEFNVMTCVENCLVHTHYAHHTKYGDYGDPNVHIYIYNHIDELVKTDNYIAIPMIWIRLAFFRSFYDKIYPTQKPPKEQQMFSILLSANWRNSEVKQSIANSLNKLGSVVTMNQFRQRMYFESCWFTELFVNFVGNFRFVMVCENSEAPGYITEKIFKPFFARVVPIYWGNNPEKYFQEGCYIDAKKLSLNELIRTVKELADDDEKYNAMVNHPKIRNEADFDYLEPMISFIKEKTDS
jgi:hypothetical protein